MSEASPVVECPRCQGLSPRPLRPGTAIIDCVHCDRSFALEAPRAEDTAQPERGPSPSRRSIGSALGPTDVPALPSGLAAVILTAIFYALVVRPLDGTYFAALFSHRGWVPYAVTLMTAWSAVILAAKYVLLRRQAQAFESDLLPEPLALDIDREGALPLISYLEGFAPPNSRSFLVTRLIRALRHFRAHGSVRDVVDQLDQQSHSDSATVDASYTLVRTFIWAIPILGFIGTVLGIGASVSGFSDSVLGAADLNVMKQSIGAVTTGLGVAFDTTLLALVVSILVMFPASWLQKAERGFLSQVQEYCDEHLVRRLVQPTSLADDSETGELNLGVRELQNQFEHLTKTLGELDERLSQMGRDSGGSAEASSEED